MAEVRVDRPSEARVFPVMLVAAVDFGHPAVDMGKPGIDIRVIFFDQLAIERFKGDCLEGVP